jgi:hypothetical protein
MKEPRLLTEFTEELRNNPLIIQHLAKSEFTSFEDYLESGELEATVHDESFLEEEFEASGGPEHIFNVEIYSFGPVYSIRANEFDDIEYFATKKEAEEYALSEYGPYIDTFEELEEDEEGE